MNEGNNGTNWEEIDVEELRKVAGGIADTGPTCRDYEGPWGPIHGEGAYTILRHLYIMRSQGYSVEEAVQICGAGKPDLERFIIDHWDLCTTRDSVYYIDLLESEGILHC